MGLFESVRLGLHVYIKWGCPFTKLVGNIGLYNGSYFITNVMAFDKITNLAWHFTRSWLFLYPSMINVTIKILDNESCILFTLSIMTPKVLTTMVLNVLNFSKSILLPAWNLLGADPDLGLHCLLRSACLSVCPNTEGWIQYIHCLQHHENTPI